VTRRFPSLLTALAMAAPIVPAGLVHARGPAMTSFAQPVDDVLAGPTGLDPHALVRGEDAAYQSYMRGQKAFEANDYDKALVELGDALRHLPDQKEYARSRGSIALWIAKCHGQLYGLRGDAAQLDLELAVLDAYAGRIETIAKDADDLAAKQALVDRRKQEIAAEKQRISGEHGDVDTQIDKSVKGEYAGFEASTWAPRVEDLAWYRRPDDPRPKGDQSDDIEPEKKVVPQQTGPRKGTGMIAGGAVALGIGVAALAVMGAGMARAKGAESFPIDQTPMQRRNQIENGNVGNAMAVGGAVAGAVLVITGAVLVAIGAKKRRADVPRAEVSGSFGRRMAGVSVRVRF
jgi:hypothetical protein